MLNPDEYPEEEREFDQYTMLGEYDEPFVALLKERCRRDSADFIRVPDYFRAHVNRGVMLLQACVRSIGGYCCPELLQLILPKKP